MDYAKNISYMKTDYICRYANVPYYYQIKDEKYFFGLSSNVFKDSPYTLHKVRPEDSLDSLALEYYNNPTLYWIIAYFNDIQDCFINLYDNYKIIKIPNYSSLRFGDER